MTLRTILIDPELRQIKEVIIDRPFLEAAEELMKCDGFDLSTKIADHGASWDYLCVDDTGLSRGEPVYAFKFSIRQDPIAGKCMIFGVDKETRDTIDAKFNIRQLGAVIDWLDLIKPEVTWVRDGDHHTGVVTYKRVKQ